MKERILAFLDIEEAYDRVGRRSLCEVMRNCGISGKIVNIISS